MGFKLVYDIARCSVWQCINFSEARVIIHCVKIIEVIAAEEVCLNFRPRSTCPLMRMQRFFGLLALKGTADAAFIYIIVYGTTYARSMQTFSGSSKAAFDLNVG